MISITDLTFGYRQGEPIITSLTYDFQPGSLTAVTGFSGKGKSTLLYLLGLLLTPWKGSVNYDGSPVADLPDRDRSEIRASTVGFVFQDAALDASRTVLDNVMESGLYAQIPVSQAKQRAETLMERFGVGLRADHKPGEVSGGQAQRVALCRALLPDPPVILADEPTGNLDATTAQVVIEAFGRLAHQENKTVIVATHDRAVMDSCDQVLAL